MCFMRLLEQVQYVCSICVVDTVGSRVDAVRNSNNMS